MENNRSIKVCYFGTFRQEYSRNQMMMAGLLANGVEVIPCHEKLWHGIEDRVNTASGGWKKPQFWGRVLRCYWRLIRKFFQLADFDILIIGYPGQLDVFLSRILCWIRRKPMVWDVFMSIYLISLERGLDKKSRLSINLLFWIENLALKLPNLLILDTREYVNWFSETYGTRPERFRLVPTGADDRIYHPIMERKPTNDDFIVLYAGTFIPNHGVMNIVEAANSIKSEQSIRFKLIGDGPEKNAAQQYANEHKLTNVQFIGWLEKEELVRCMGQADICLGAFGNTPQSLMTVQNKIYEAMAMKKPVISGDSPAIRQVCRHGENIYLCERENGSDIAQAILTLKADPTLREKIAQNGYALFKQNYDLVNIGRRFYINLQEVHR